ncbi:MAG: tetratricopeptide repeat protein [Candidatus Sedimenticola sp. 6PFRAG5]
MEINLDTLHHISRHISNALDRVTRHVELHLLTYARLYAVALVVFVLGYQLVTPIMKGDTDMWYHLTGGRFFWENGEVPTRPFFSFLHPDREWINYFWGFQASIFKIHDLFGYQGLVITRALLVAGMISVVFLFLFEQVKSHKNLALFVLLTAVFVIFLETRGLQLRPHLVSYLMIGLFLYILEEKPKLTPALPLLTVVWVNMHGIEWVIGGLICGAYFVEHIANLRYHPDRAKEKPRSFPYWILLCGLGLGLNPYGFKILAAPFVVPPMLDQFIGEMKPIGTDALHTFVLNDLTLTGIEGLVVITFLALVALISSISTRSLRISHLIFFVGGAYLLSRGNRFSYEWAFLVLPLIGTWSRSFHWHLKTPHKTAITAVITASLLAVPFATIGSKIDLTRDYPIQEARLPVGVSHFLDQINAKGRMLIPPTDGGYVQWRHYPDILIHSDMEFPPFNELDFIEIAKVFNNTETFKKLSRKYQIDYVVVPITQTSFLNIVDDASPFKPVFFDNDYILYASKDRQPSIVSTYELEEIIPYNLLIQPEDSEKAIAELKRVVDIYPDSRRTYHGLAMLLMDEKNYSEAQQLAETMIEMFPHDSNGYRIMASIHKETDQCPKAIEYYKKAEPMIPAGSNYQSLKKDIKQAIGSCYYEMKDLLNAYKYLNESTKHLSRNESVDNLYSLAVSALVTGNTYQAKVILKDILLQTPEDDEEYGPLAKDLMKKIEDGEFD